MDDKISKKIEELQLLEAHLQNFLLQKQAIQVELNEIENALGELENADDVYKITSGFLIKSSREKVEKELKEKNRLFNARIEAMVKQEKLIEKDITKLKEEIDKTSN